MSDSDDSNDDFIMGLIMGLWIADKGGGSGRDKWRLPDCIIYAVIGIVALGVIYAIMWRVSH